MRIGSNKPAAGAKQAVVANDAHEHVPAPASRAPTNQAAAVLLVNGGCHAAPVQTAQPARDVMKDAKEATRLADLAVAYAAAGKHQLAAKRLGEAKAVALEGDHPAVLAAKEAVLAAEAGVAKLAGVKPVDAGKPEKTKTVVISGLSANPPTGMGGHAGIVSWGAKELKVDLPNDAEPKKAREDVPIDEVWVLPVYKHAFAEKRGLLDFDHRFEMARLAFEHLPGLEGRVKVKDTERQVVEKAIADAGGHDKVKVGTIDLIRALASEHPDTQFVLALGGDTYQDLMAGKWKESEALRAMIPIVVIPRAGVDGVAGSEANAPKLSDISSTKVRGSTDVDFLSQALHPDVLKYIVDHKLYAFAEPKDS